jgi:hypothetical protein
MATGQGTVTIDFGVFPGSQEASVAFTDATIGAASKVEPYVMADGVAGTHTANDHRYLPLLAQFTALPSAGVGGTIYGRALMKMIGLFQLRYVWAD